VVACLQLVQKHGSLLNFALICDVPVKWEAVALFDQFPAWFLVCSHSFRPWFLRYTVPNMRQRLCRVLISIVFTLFIFGASPTTTASKFLVSVKQIPFVLKSTSKSGVSDNYLVIGGIFRIQYITGVRDDMDPVPELAGFSIFESGQHFPQVLQVQFCNSPNIARQNLPRRRQSKTRIYLSSESLLSPSC
jgi:hypothetical protein